MKKKDQSAHEYTKNMLGRPRAICNLEGSILPSGINTRYVIVENMGRANSNFFHVLLSSTVPLHLPVKDSRRGFERKLVAMRYTYTPIYCRSSDIKTNPIA